MTLFKWKCTKCAFWSRKMLAERPKLDPCPDCGSPTAFVSNVGGTVLETIDNGLMAKKVNWYKDQSDLIDNHADLPDEQEPDII